ncbi:MAG TPA: 50S ribosomal protein L4, partial [Rectinema sp.]|nr:50S ribosomal protein L4 [Rectinema sp.]
GGVSFGPKPRDYSYSIPRKEKQLSLKTILSLKIQDELMTIIEDFTVESGKTKDLIKVLSNVVDIKNPERTVLILKDDDPMIKRAARNIPWLTYLTYNRLRAHDLFYARRVIMMEGASAKLNEFYAKAAKES